MVGTAAGERKDPQTMVPKAINSVIWRIGLFYVGSVVLLVMLLPWSAYQAGQSPFVTFFSKLGVPYIGSITNIVGARPLPSPACTQVCTAPDVFCAQWRWAVPHRV